MSIILIEAFYRLMAILSEIVLYTSLGIFVVLIIINFISIKKRGIKYKEGWAFYSFIVLCVSALFFTFFKLKIMTL